MFRCSADGHRKRMTKTASQDALQSVYSLRREVLIFYHVIFYACCFSQDQEGSKEKAATKKVS